MSSIRQLVFFLSIITIFIACEQENIEPQEDNFDRNVIVQNWVDNMIIPTYQVYLDKLTELSLDHKDFQVKKDQASLNTLQETFIDAYKAWQSVSMFEIGEAEKVNLRNFTNLYPCNTNLVEKHIRDEEYNLSLPSTFAAQGFPALDFLLFDAGQKNNLVNVLASPAYANYVSDLLERMIDLTSTVSSSWTNQYRSSFISDRTSIDRMVNDFMFYFEKFLRAGKVGIPAGVFSGSSLSTNVEALYSDIYSRDLLLEALTAVDNFFTDNSLDSYLTFMGRQDLSQEIKALWASAKAKIEDLDPSLRKQIETDNTKMLEVYDELQKAVILLKVDMFQALNIQVDYVDADGD